MWITTVLGVEIPILRAVRVRLVRVSDVIEKMDLVFWKEEGDPHHVYRRVAPSLSRREKGIWKISVESRFGSRSDWRLHLVVKPAGALEVVHVSSVRFTSPESHIRDLHVTPVYQMSATGELHRQTEEPTVATVVCRTVVAWNELHRAVWG